MDPNDQSPGHLEEHIRRMILHGGPGEEEDTRPRVRLPPSASPFLQQPPPPVFTQYGPPWLNGSPVSPVSPHGPAFPPPLPAPHMMPQNVRGPYPQSGPPPNSAPPHMRHSHYQQNPGMYGRPPPQFPPQNMHHPRQNQYGPGPPQRPHAGQRQQRQQRGQQIQLDPDAFNRGGPVQHQGHTQTQPRHLYDPHGYVAQHSPFGRPEFRDRTAQYLDQVVAEQMSAVDMSEEERNEKESFRQTLEKLCAEVCRENPNLPKVSLECFGSFQSGFASAGSDMDLVIVVQDRESSLAAFSLLEDDLPRALERKMLRAGHGARLLTRTRVPIIKVCQSPGGSFLDKLRQERERWDDLPNEKKYPHLHQGGDDDDENPDEEMNLATTGAKPEQVKQVTEDTGSNTTNVETSSDTPDPSTVDGSHPPSAVQTLANTVGVDIQSNGQHSATAKREQSKTWTRERKPGPLDFPKDGVGIQCDINFFNPLGLHNTQLLRCYSLCDPRVRPIVLFVKSWAKLRGINSSYSGTLSSYGYVLMVLHFLMNVAQPPVIPNLQSHWRPTPACTAPGVDSAEIDGWKVDFWRNEEEIKAAVQSGQMSSNQESIGSLLAGFFQYYSSQGNGPQFRWVQQVLSLRTPTGILTKDAKGWVKAMTEEGEGKKIQHRYLFCIEDPFELNHNVARTVTHNGIVAIRDEFRRAHRILTAVGLNMPPREGHLCDKLVEVDPVVQASRLGRFDSTSIQQGSVHAPIIQPLGQTGQGPHQRQPNGSAKNTREKAPKAKANALNMADEEAFPTLGMASTNKAKNNKSNGNTKPAGEISGHKAQEYLEDFRRKKAEAEAEKTAKEAAESVLCGDD